MQNLQRRVSGVYVTRLTVPVRLRAAVGRRELIASTGTHLLSLAKLVASAQLAKWRQHLFDLDRLALNRTFMDYDSILKIADGHPLLGGDGYLPLDQVAIVLGLSSADVLRKVTESRLRLFRRFNDVMGFLLPLEALEPDDLELGTVVVPAPDRMPATAIAHSASGVFAVPADAVMSVVGDLLVSGQTELVLFAAPGGDLHRAFVPDVPGVMTMASTELDVRDVERLRLTLAATLTPDRITAAREAQKAASRATPSHGGKHADRLFSEALEAYGKHFLPQRITNGAEIERVKSGIRLFVELDDDLPLKDIDAARLRSFRDTKLALVPARENQVRHLHGTTSVSESIRAVAGTSWPKMSAAERDQRMQWIGRMFRWLVAEKWITDDPTTSLRGESVESKAERKVTASKKRPREPFTQDEIRLVFSTTVFQSGFGARTKGGTFREFSPFHYWLPLLGLYTGARINELCQLRLADVGVTPSGTAYLDINENSPDKSLKKQKDSTRVWSQRKVPVHPVLVEQGFLTWCDRLRSAGYVRLFPELAWSEKTHYAKEPIRFMSTYFHKTLQLPRDGTKVFHSFRHTVNNALTRMTTICPPELRKRLLGHEPGPGANEKSYTDGFTPEEGLVVLRQLPYALPAIARFDPEAGLQAVTDALRRKDGGRGAVEDLGPSA